MVFSLTNSIVDNCKRIQWQYVSLVAGLGLAAFLAINLHDSSSTQPVTAGRVQSSVIWKHATFERPNSEVVFYLVNDEIQQAQAISSEAATSLERELIGTSALTRSVHVIFVRTAPEEARAHLFIFDAMAAANFSDGRPAPRFEVVDMRTP